MSSLFWSELEASLISYERWLRVTNVIQEDQTPYDKKIKTGFRDLLSSLEI